MLDVARFAQVQFSFALVVLLIALAALAWRNVFGRPPAPDLVLPSWLQMPSVSEASRQRARLVLDGGLALIAVSLALFSMTAGQPSAIDRKVVLHEQLQAKYHAELGWDGLYACAWAADRDGERALTGVETLRLLELGPAPNLEPTPTPERDARGVRKRVKPKPPSEVGGKLIPARAARAKIDCRGRFSDERWAAFAADIATLVALDPERPLGSELSGHGSSASPARLARQRILFSVVPLGPKSLFTLALLSGLLALAALVVVERAYGLRVAALVGIAVFAEFASSPIAGGVTATGTLLVALALAGFAAAELDRWGLAGALLGLVAIELVWPVLLVLGLLAKLGVDALDGQPRKRELVRLGAGALASASVALLVSASLPGGLGNWSIWADQVALVRYLDGAGQIGLRWLFAPDGNLLGTERWVDYPIKAQHLVDRGDWILVSGLLLLTPALLAVRRLPPVAFASVAGVTATFALTSLEARSWGLALPLLVLAAGAIAKHHPPSRPLVGRPTTVLIAGCLALIVGMHGLVRLHQSPFFLFNIVYSHLLTTLLLGLAVALILIPDLREHGDPPGGPPAVPVLNPETAAAPMFPLLARLRARKPGAPTRTETATATETERGER
jgi:hypothetical protein